MEESDEHLLPFFIQGPRLPDHVDDLQQCQLFVPIHVALQEELAKIMDLVPDKARLLDCVFFLSQLLLHLNVVKRAHHSGEIEELHLRILGLGIELLHQLIDGGLRAGADDWEHLPHDTGQLHDGNGATSIGVGFLEHPLHREHLLRGITSILPVGHPCRTLVLDPDMDESIHVNFLVAVGQHWCAAKAVYEPQAAERFGRILRCQLAVGAARKVYKDGTHPFGLFLHRHPDQFTELPRVDSARTIHIHQFSEVPLLLEGDLVSEVSEGLPDVVGADRRRLFDGVPCNHVVHVPDVATRQALSTAVDLKNLPKVCQAEFGIDVRVFNGLFEGVGVRDIPHRGDKFLQLGRIDFAPHADVVLSEQISEHFNLAFADL
mmetsp:Transcript_20167/g.55842  ORF Transcript_20167/g.55842 Transcript_20167/m.55842 type:complete len:376 (+) Transcript_20167:232-1359(+)